MRKPLGVLLLFGALAFAGCQQTQEAADEPDDTTVIKEKETVVKPSDQQGSEQTDVKMDVKVEGEGEGASGQVQTGDQGASGEVKVRGESASGEAKVQNP